MPEQDAKKIVNDILLATAPEAARRLESAVKYGENLKKDQAYEAALEVLDRIGVSKKTETTVTHQNAPSLPPEFIAGALTYMAKMFNVESEMSLAAAATASSPSDTITSTYELDDETTPTSEEAPVNSENNINSGSENDAGSEAQITMSEPPDPNDVPFNVSSGLKDRSDET